MIKENFTDLALLSYSIYSGWTVSSLGKSGDYVTQNAPMYGYMQDLQRLMSKIRG